MFSNQPGRFAADYGRVLPEAVSHLARQLGLDPVPSTLERLVTSVAVHAVQNLFERIAAGLPERLRDTIEDLVNVPDGEHRSPLAK